jgi:hypothetical protein
MFARSTSTQSSSLIISSHTLDVFGPDRIVMGSDYPFDVVELNPIGHISGVPGGDEAMLASFRADMPSSLLDLDFNAVSSGIRRFTMLIEGAADICTSAGRQRGLRRQGQIVDFKSLRREPDGGTTNIRNASSAHSKRWL